MRPAALGRGALCGGLLVGGGPLLARMAREQRHDGGFSTSTAAGVYAAWATWTGLLADAVVSGARRDRPSATSPGVVAGGTAATLGAALFAVGAGAFPSGAQLTGTQTTDLVTGGVYRFSRNPQYLGAVLLGAGSALAARSGRAAGLTVALGVVLHGWSQVEEEVLEARFGAAYRAYRSRTPRWAGAWSAATRLAR